MPKVDPQRHIEKIQKKVLIWTMRPWSFPVSLSVDSPESLFLQITRAITGDIERGRLKPGAVLPGSRTLAQNLGVHRNTVLAAYRELCAEGWIQSAGRTTRVVEDVPARAGRGLPGVDRLGYALPVPEGGGAASWTPGERGLSGLPDLRLLPFGDLGQAFRRALRRQDLLDYGDSRGNRSLREGLSGMLAEMRGLACTPEQILVTGGSQMALELIARTLIEAGDRVLVEDPGYPQAWEVFREAGAEVVPVPVDASGMRVDQVERLAREGPVRLVYTTPHHQYPTMVTLAAARRLHLLECAARHRFAIVEDDYDFEFHYQGHPVLPLASRDPGGVVIYVGTLSKVLAPGFRLGFVAAPRPMVDALAARRLRMDRQGNQIMEQMVADLLSEGLLQRHVRKMRRIYGARREALAQALREHLGGTLAFELPSGGMNIWAQVCPGLDIDAWLERARHTGGGYSPGRLFDFHGLPLQGLRLGFSRQTEEELRRDVRILAGALG